MQTKEFDALKVFQAGRNVKKSFDLRNALLDFQSEANLLMQELNDNLFNFKKVSDSCIVIDPKFFSSKESSADFEPKAVFNLWEEEKNILFLVMIGCSGYVSLEAYRIEDWGIFAWEYNWRIYFTKNSVLGIPFFLKSLELSPHVEGFENWNFAPAVQDDQTIYNMDKIREFINTVPVPAT